VGQLAASELTCKTVALESSPEERSRRRAFGEIAL
jgi:hypothetical protein